MESLCYTPETSTMLYVNCISRENKINVKGDKGNMQQAFLQNQVVLGLCLSRLKVWMAHT